MAKPLLTTPMLLFIVGAGAFLWGMRQGLQDITRIRDRVWAALSMDERNQNVWLTKDVSALTTSEKQQLLQMATARGIPLTD